MNTYIISFKKYIVLFGILLSIFGLMSFVSVEKIEARPAVCGDPAATGHCIPPDPTGPTGPIVNSGNNIGDVYKDDKRKDYRVIAYEGWLTPSYIVKKECKDGTVTDNYTDGKVAEEVDNRDWITKILGPPLQWIAQETVRIIFEPVKCDDERDILSLSVTTDIAKIGQSVNVVQNPIIMKLAGIMQWLAYGLALLYIVFYSLMYMIGQQQINPYKFVTRLFFASVMVWYAPYIAQDILNLNNVLVYTFSSLSFTFDGASAASSGDIAWAIYSYIDAMVGALNENLLFGIIAIFMVFYLIGPLINLLLWWYGRLLKILFYTIISPIMMMMMALPQTAKMASQWFRSFIGEVFSQAFVVMGMVLISLILVNLNDMDKLIGLGFIGKALLVFAALNFMSGLPGMASAFIGNIGGSTPSSGDLFRMTKKMKNSAQSTGRAVKNAPGKVASGVGKVSDAIESGKKAGSDFVAAYKANKNQSLENAAFKGEGKSTRGSMRAAVKTGGAAGLAGAMMGKVSGANKVASLTGAVSRHNADGSKKSKADILKEKKGNLKSQLMRDHAKTEMKDMKKEGRELEREQAIAKYKAQFATGTTGKEQRPEDKEVLKDLRDAKEKRFNTRADIESYKNEADEGFNKNILGNEQHFPARMVEKKDDEGNIVYQKVAKKDSKGNVITDDKGNTVMEEKPVMVKEQNVMEKIKKSREKQQKINHFTKGTITDDDKTKKNFSSIKNTNNNGGGKKGGRKRK